MDDREALRIAASRRLRDLNVYPIGILDLRFRQMTFRSTQGGPGKPMGRAVSDIRIQFATADERAYCCSLSGSWPIMNGRPTPSSPQKKICDAMASDLSGISRRCSPLSMARPPDTVGDLIKGHQSIDLRFGGVGTENNNRNAARARFRFESGQNFGAIDVRKMNVE